MTSVINIHLIVRFVLAALALFGTVAAFNISQAQWTGSAACPSIGSLPACYVVLAGYSLMVLSAIFARRLLFLIGWVPVFLLAAIGSISEIIATAPVCPRTPNGIPQCYLSLGLVMIIGLVSFFLFQKGLEKRRD